VKKTVLIQCPRKFCTVIPIFCKECLKHGIFDKIYCVTDGSISVNDKRCQIITHADKQFSANLLFALDYIEEDVFLLCCEDHIMIERHNKEEFEQTWKFMMDNPNVGSLRLTHNRNVKFSGKSDINVNFSSVDSGLIKELSNKYSYLWSAQPSWTQKKYLSRILKEGENAWQAEVYGSKRARKGQFKKYCVTRDIYHATNFYKKGQYVRSHFVDYSIKNKLGIKFTLPVFVKQLVPIDGVDTMIKSIVPVSEYIHAKRKGTLNTILWQYRIVKR
jgi:hypothetical protein